jgi:hypothetical protein
MAIFDKLQGLVDAYRRRSTPASAEPLPEVRVTVSIGPPHWVRTGLWRQTVAGVIGGHIVLRQAGEYLDITTGRIAWGVTAHRYGPTPWEDPTPAAPFVEGQAVQDTISWEDRQQGRRWPLARPAVAGTITYHGTRDRIDPTGLDLPPIPSAA